MAEKTMGDKSRADKNKQLQIVPVLDRLHKLLENLGLSEAEAMLENHLDRAAREDLSYAEMLCELLESEISSRHSRNLATRLKLSHLPYRKSLGQFDFSFQPSIEPRQIRELQTLRFLHDSSNVIFLGPPGVGKTHLAVGLAMETMEAGMSVYFVTAQEMIVDLAEAAKEGRLAKRMQVYLRPRVLIIDEMGYLPLSEMGATVLFQLVSGRYEKGSIILTSNKSYGDWGNVFKDPVIAAAILDRLLHHSTTINIRGESYRLKDKRRSGVLSRPKSIAQAAQPVQAEQIEEGDVQTPLTPGDSDA